MLARKKVRPIRENDIIFGEALFNCRWRGYDKNGAGTKSKGEYRTIFVRKLLVDLMVVTSDAGAVTVTELPKKILGIINSKMVTTFLAR
ncbi:hypothetical protein RJ639_003934 [Escallonia herrerae]|uniref:Uncharacterized protein n=1 Tax=Escallonia herrerae TaxID=1293975 RepID=A0AA88WAD7_9ASTE|nr:hypothetical protein RJ639_003934 [Escallonia herrerae]